MDKVDTLDTLLFGKNRNKNMFCLVIGIYYNQDILTSKSIKNIFFQSDFKGVHPVNPVHLSIYYKIVGKDDFR